MSFLSYLAIFKIKEYKERERTMEKEERRKKKMRQKRKERKEWDYKRSYGEQHAVLKGSCASHPKCLMSSINVQILGENVSFSAAFRSCSIVSPSL